MIKLGKLQPRIDKRTIQLRTILKALAPPASYNVYQALGFTPKLQMWGNDAVGDCVMVAQANFETVLQYLQQKKIIPITTGIVENQYYREQGATWCHPHPDRGLVELDVLNWWRNKGWKVGGNTYKIYAHAAFHWQDDTEFMSAIYYLYGAMIGIALPITAQAQWNKGEPWDVVEGPGSDPGSWGLHGVYVPAGDPDYYYCDTWGKIQKMTRAFVRKYVDEAHAVVPQPDAWVTPSPVDLNTLDNILAEIEASSLSVQEARYCVTRR